MSDHNFKHILQHSTAMIALLKRMVRDTYPRHYEQLVIFISLLITEEFVPQVLDLVTLPNLFKVYYTVLSGTNEYV